MDGYCERFDGLTGDLPPHIAVNSVDETSRQIDAEGWCNYGQQAPCTHSYSGASSLEMGLNPATSNFHQVANSLIIGLDGSGAQNWDMEMRVLQMGEEWNADDGVFLSNDGLDWQPVLTDWTHMTGGPTNIGHWKKVTCDLASTNVDVTGPFFLAVSQADDFPFNSQDGVVIDDLCIGGDIQALRYQASNLVAGAAARLEVTGLDPLAFVAMMVSLQGPGPTATPYGLADIGMPYFVIAYVDADKRGEVRISKAVPPWTQGMTVWSQAAEILNFESRLTPAWAEVVQ